MSAFISFHVSPISLECSLFVFKQKYLCFKDYKLITTTTIIKNGPLAQNFHKLNSRPHTTIPVISDY